MLEHLAIIRFIGSDAQSFLHGQLTCDVKALATGKACFGGYCTPKGRLLATFLLAAESPEHYTMILPAAIAAPIAKRLSMYVLRAKVKTGTDSAGTGIVGFAPEFATAASQSLTINMPGTPMTLAQQETTCLLRLNDGRLLIWGPAPAIAALPEQMDSSTWQAADIAAGLPWVTPSTQEEFVPQMVNLDLVGGLSYQKGCYPGQEIVARTHYLGRLKQRLFRARVNAAVQSGDKLFSEDMGEQASGMILNAVSDNQGGSDVLAVLRLDSLQQTVYHAGNLSGPALTLDTLPYEVK
jgi:folate-binding protein YgfZ